MRKPCAPCKDCDSATGGCKLTCKEWKEYEEQYQLYKSIVKKNIERENNKWRERT